MRKCSNPRLAPCLAVLAWLAALAGCRPVEDPKAHTRVEPLALPASAVAAQPDLVTSPDGHWLLSWVEPVKEKRHRLMVSQSDPGLAWKAPKQIAEGDDWFLNWADTPHVYALADGSLWAHWLRNTGPGRMDYGIALTRSGDGGASWSAPVQVELADSPGDHGFVSFWAQSKNRLGLAWLDSRQKAAQSSMHSSNEAEMSDHHGGDAAMMLRAAFYDAQGASIEKQGEWPLDVSTCDCCTTSSAITPRGTVVVYRGRTGDEIRDTRLVRFDGKHWSAPRDVHADGWQVAGCPVNGPAVVARGNTLWVVWYTEADGLPELRAARSDDAGDLFSAPVSLARGPEVLGRATIALADSHVLVVWLEQVADQSQQLVMMRMDEVLQQPRRVQVASLAARGRASGLPRLAVLAGEARVVWTDVVDGHPVLRGARVR